MAGKKKKGTKDKEPKTSAEGAKDLTNEEEDKKEEEFNKLVNIPTHGWVKINVM